MEEKKLENGRIYVWGAMTRGRQICNLLKQAGKKVEYMIDNNKSLHGSKIDGIQVVGFCSVVDMLNETDTIIIGMYTIVNEQQVREQIRKSGFSGNIWGSMEFHDKFEIPYYCNQAKAYSYQTEFCHSLQGWLDNILEEVEFWDKEAATPQGKHYQHYLERIKSKEFECSRIKDMVKGGDVVLDVGSGICSQYGSFLNKKEQIVLKGIDPLAPFYNTINRRFAKEHELDFQIAPVEFGFFELLSFQYGKAYSDYILIDNALDHCIDPFTAITECLQVLKIGGTLSMAHHVDEAYKAFYSGLHQWNICCDEDNDFVIWNKKNYINVTQKLSEYTDIQTHREMINSDVTPFGLVICNLIKKKELPMEYFVNERERAGMLMKGFMEKLSDLNFALEYLKIMAL